VEGKNGAVIRKLIGYGYIAGEHAEAISKFYMRHLKSVPEFSRIRSGGAKGLACTLASAVMTASQEQAGESGTPRDSGTLVLIVRGLH
jgi:hypothetical protein